jgi:hypothetical protein
MAAITASLIGAAALIGVGRSAVDLRPEPANVPSTPPSPPPSLSPLEAEHLSNLRQVTQGMVKAGEGYFSPDGGDIVYQAVPQNYPFYQNLHPALRWVHRGS